IAYSLSERPVMEMVNTMLDGAFPKLRPGDAPLLHSDQGWHYRWICPYISRHLLSLNPLLARCRRYSRGER
ncbi:hypothetical protein VAJ17_26235, partial [Klebsiella pneumoniae]